MGAFSAMNLGKATGLISGPSLIASPLLKASVIKPRPKGVAMTTAMPSSRQVAKRFVPAVPSISREKTEYSVCTAAMGAILHARRTVVEVTMVKPMCFILPSLLNQHVS